MKLTCDGSWEDGRAKQQVMIPFQTTNNLCMPEHAQADAVSHPLPPLLLICMDMLSWAEFELISAGQQPSQL